ncbi:HD domain-containing phosphohydrolase [Sulfurimonas sp.]|uniref:HD-GYP domain-containing protein n=1 Tax=Sulfurimonas sp. TaxID=2022749 RepID=UPI0025F4FC27|nr:HD domain-containing phosphohydrolase [Sulfurimonas sp.]MCK9473953.1 HD domain-containing protein [Sulfurimonas sp.]
MTNNQKKSIINFGLNKLKSILDINSNNIVSSFFKRALFSVIFISIISTIFIINFQQYTFYTSLADEIRTNVDERLDKYSENLKFTDMKILKEDVKVLMEQLGFITIEIYDDKKEKFFKVASAEEKFANKLKLIQTDYKLIGHNFPTSKKMNYNFFEISDKHNFMQIFYPIYKSNRLLGYIEGISYIEPIVVERFKQGIFTTIVTVMLTIFIFSLLIFPLIYFAYKKLNAHRLELLSSNIMTINTLGNAIALRDSDTNEHNYRVTLYAIKFAQSINLDNENIKVLIKGAFLHDVGKIGISDNILLKNGSLNEEEFEIMRSHVVKGVELVNDDSWLEDAKAVILYHHERYDGSGYPNKVKNKEIPITARIFAIVDVFDALTSKRPYKEPFSYEKSIEILKDGYNSQFDGELLNHFIKISNKLYTDARLKQKEELKKELESLIKKYFLE